MMRLLIKWLKFTIIFATTTAAVYSLSVPFVSAQISGSGCNSCEAQIETYTGQISAYTKVIMNELKNVPNYLVQAGKFMLNWTAPDRSKETQNLQSQFTQIGNQFINDYNSVNDYKKNLPQLNATLFDVSPSAFTSEKSKSSILNTVPQVNKLTYSTVLNHPPVKNAPGTSYDYITNASGMGITHTPPATFWQGKADDKKTYMNYYNTIMSVVSYNSYILDNLVADQNKLTPLQNQLIQQASSADWLAKVAGEEMAIVLRQLLMFQSQTYVLISQLLTTQRQMLNAQVMTNAIAIANNQVNESILAGRAQGITPTS